MQPDVLDPSIPIACDARSPWLDRLIHDWEDKDTSLDVIQALYRFDLVRAAQPPVVNVTVTGVPGYFSHVAGTGDISYKPEEPVTEEIPVVVVPEEPET